MGVLFWRRRGSSSAVMGRSCIREFALLQGMKGEYS